MTADEGWGGASPRVIVWREPPPAALFEHRYLRASFARLDPSSERGALSLRLPIHSSGIRFGARVIHPMVFHHWIVSCTSRMGTSGVFMISAMILYETSTEPGLFGSILTSLT